MDAPQMKRGKDIAKWAGEIAFFDDPKRCAEMCNKLADELGERNTRGVSVFPKGTKRILLTGTPLTIPNWKLHHIIETSCACFTPNPGRIEDILRLAKEYQVDGVIAVNLKFCCLYDTERCSVENACKEAGIRFLGLETDYTDSDAEQLKTRIGAFLELMR